MRSTNGKYPTLFVPPSIISSIKCEEMPYLNENINTEHLNGNDKTLTPEEIDTVKNYFSCNPNMGKCVLIDNMTGRKRATVIRLESPIDKKTRFLRLYYGKKHGKGLGQGAYGKVGLMEDIDTGEWYAIKTFKYNPRLPKDNHNGLGRLDSANVEYDNLLALNQTVGAKIFHCKDGIHDKCLLSMKLMPGVNLFKYILRNPGMTPVRSLQIAVNMLKAADELHRRGYLHRDINPNNMVIDLRNNKINLIDFGFMTKTLKLFHASVYGTDGYLPDDVRIYQEYDPKTDMYSIGKSLLDLPALKTISDQKLRKKIINYISTLCSHIKGDRPSFTQAIKYLTEIQTEFQDVLSKVRKVGIVDIKELLACENYPVKFNALTRAMKEMDFIWFIDTEKRGKKEYYAISRKLKANNVNVGHHLFTIPDKSINASEVAQYVPDLRNAEINSEPHSLFYITGEPLFSYQVSNLQKNRITTLRAGANNFENHAETIRNCVCKEHLLREEYNYVKQFLGKIIKDYNEAIARVPDNRLKEDSYFLAKTLDELGIAYANKTLTVQILFNALEALKSVNRPRSLLAIEHLKGMERLYAPKVEPAPVARIEIGRY